MKIKPIMWILFILFSTFGWTSCDKESDGPLSLDLVENNATKLYYGSKGGVTIIGGDGNYSFFCESPLLKAEKTYSNYISFEPLGVGDATVKIKDSSGNSYILNVTIAYKTEKVVVSKLDATVVGDNMTVGNQKELKEKVLATIPVKVGGGYKFVYTESEDQEETKGTVFIYPDKFGDNGIEGTFERGIVKGDDGSYSHIVYTLHYSDMNRTFVFMEYSLPTGKSSQYRAPQFAEDLKEQYTAAYPNVEQVYTSQVIGRHGNRVITKTIPKLLIRWVPVIGSTAMKKPLPISGKRLFYFASERVTPSHPLTKIASNYTTYVLEVVSPPLPVQLVWKNSPRGLSVRS